MIILIRIKEMYIGIPKNYMSLTIIKCIFADGKAILLVVIMPSIIIIVS